MNKRSISPLIATFILISLTVAVGAMIVAWGRGYVQRQMECIKLGASLSLILKNTSASPQSIELHLINTGEATINLNDIYFKLLEIDKSDICPYKTGKCNFDEVNGETEIKPTELGLIKIYIYPDSKVNVNNVRSMELYHKSCNQLLATVNI